MPTEDKSKNITITADAKQAGDGSTENVPLVLSPENQGIILIKIFTTINSPKFGTFWRLRKFQFAKIRCKLLYSLISLVVCLVCDVMAPLTYRTLSVLSC